MIKIEIEKNTRQVYLNNSYIGNDNENLQDNLEFSFKDEFVDGQARLELQFENKEKTFIVLDKVEETYTTPITNIMTVKGQVYAQLVVTEGTDEESIPIFKSNIFYFYVGDSINAETGDDEPYIEWIDRANVKLNQMDNLNIEAEKVEHTTTITVTRKDGTSYEVEVLDGEKGDKGEKGDAGAIKMQIVNELPLVGSEDTIYLVPIANPEEQGNNYDEYIYVNNTWEKLGGIQVEVDLTDYVKNTDYATSSKGGAIKTTTNYATYVNPNNGQLSAETKTYENYTNGSNSMFIGKATLENVITGKGLVSNTDYATNDKGGVFKTGGYGATLDGNGKLNVSVIPYSTYSQVSNTYMISKGTLENVLDARIGDIDSVLDAINGEVI